VPRAVVTGGAGFLGSHLSERLLAEGWDVVAVDSFITGREDNVAGALGHTGFSLVEADVSSGLEVAGPIDAVFHLASPASPPDYLEHPIATLRVGALGTLNALHLASDRGARFLLTSTSEVYGDPLVNPQPESYWGNVNPVGPRSVYDESKRYAEALTMAYHREGHLETRVVRIFNTYGPRMRRDDGRAVPNFIDQAISGRPLTVHGDGSQTRSLCYVDDLIEGIWRLFTSDHIGPMNIGNPEELTVLQLAETIRSLAGSSSEISFTGRPVDDPNVRCPDISVAREVLGWEPKVALDAGLRTTISWARGRGSS
jgi:nucleoside-diphosphate-sugar epimerase